MQEDRNACQVSWGAHVNTKWRYKAKDYPAWANRLQQESWTKTGLIVWEAEDQRIVRLSATEALSVLEHLRNDEAWKDRGIVGEPTTLTGTSPF